MSQNKVHPWFTKDPINTRLVQLCLPFTGLEGSAFYFSKASGVGDLIGHRVSFHRLAEEHSSCHGSIFLKQDGITIVSAGLSKIEFTGLKIPAEILVCLDGICDVLNYRGIARIEQGVLDSFNKKLSELMNPSELMCPSEATGCPGTPLTSPSTPDTPSESIDTPPEPSSAPRAGEALELLAIEGFKIIRCRPLSYESPVEHNFRRLKGLRNLEFRVSAECHRKGIKCPALSSLGPISRSELSDVDFSSLPPHTVSDALINIHAELLILRRKLKID